MFQICESGDTPEYDTNHKRALWECARRAGRGRVVSLTCDSWRDAGGKLWEPNTLANVALPTLKISEQMMLIAEVTYRIDGDRGTTAELTLAPPAAYAPQPIILFPQLQELG
jgi:prophage tail gpP-like protein